eukprot:ctg_6624.g696
MLAVRAPAQRLPPAGSVRRGRQHGDPLAGAAEAPEEHRRLRARIGWYQWRGRHEHALQQALALERAALEADATQMRGLAESLRATA